MFVEVIENILEHKLGVRPDKVEVTPEEVIYVRFDQYINKVLVKQSLLDYTGSYTVIVEER